MQVNKVNLINYDNYKYSFGRKLRPEEEQDYRKNALQPAFDYLGTKEVAMIVHGSCYPEVGKDLGVGSPFGEASKKFIPFEMLHGFNSNQLGPIGVIRNPKEISPYTSTIATKNYLFVDFYELTKDAYANILSKDFVDYNLINTVSNGKNYAFSNFSEAFANYNFCMKTAYKNFKDKLSENDENAVRLNEEFSEFKDLKYNEVAKDALFDILSKQYQTMDFSKWNDVDKNLISGIKDKDENSISRVKKILNRSREDFDTYIFGQFIAEKQIKDNAEFRKSLGFKYISDLLVGFSPSDEWAHQDLFLKDWRVGCPYGGKYGPQLWDIPLLNPNKLFKQNDELDSAGIYLKKKLEASLDNFDNVRIDHSLGLVDPFIYYKKSVKYNGDIPDFRDFVANNVSNMPEIDPRKNYQKVLNKIILPTLEEHGISKDSPVWEDLCTQTHAFHQIYHVKNNLPGITQLEYMRGENSKNPENWGLVGSHDSNPASEMIKKDWVKGHDAWNIFYLAGFLNSNPKRAYYRDSFCKQIAENDSDRVKAKFAELFLTCKKIQISFVDFLGIDKTYNVGGQENDANWKLRINKDYEDMYYKNLASEHPTAMNLPEILKIAVQAKSDIETVKISKLMGLSDNEIPENNPTKVNKILDNLDKYEKILKE